MEIDARNMRIICVARDEESPQVCVLNNVVLRGELRLSGSLSRLANRAGAVRRQEQEQWDVR